MTATFQKMTKTFDQAAFDKFVAQQIKSMERQRAKGARDFAQMTDAEILASARSMARIYGAGTVLVAA